jgi:hypothetical protein
VVAVFDYTYIAASDIERINSPSGSSVKDVRGSVGFSSSPGDDLSALALDLTVRT